MLCVSTTVANTEMRSSLWQVSLSNSERNRAMVRTGETTQGKALAQSFPVDNTAVVCSGRKQTYVYVRYSKAHAELG